ncbi:MAG: hypothetical protein JXA93_17840, partial [Anaerolineae bacterium]|nr:hypothetical protein [Anaerolineae bacterium]
ADYKIQALDAMRETVNELSSEVTRAQSYLDRVRHNELTSATADLKVLAALKADDGAVTF